MHAIILAAGKCSRFWPLNENGHKSLIRLFGKSILEHTINSVQNSKIKNIIIVSCDGKILKNANIDGKDITEIIQHEPKGMGDAVLKAKDQTNESFFVLNSNHINSSEILKKCITEQKNKNGCVLVGAKTNNPSLYGVFEFDGVNACEIIEKPAKGSEPSDVRVVGVYLLNSKFLELLEKTHIEEYSFEKALSNHIAKNKTPVVHLNSTEVPQSLKYPWDLFSILNVFFKDKNVKTDIQPTVKLSKNAVIDDSKGAVIIGKNTKIMECATIRGPVYIGANCLVGNNAIVRDYSNIEDKVIIGANTEVARSIIQTDVHIHSGFVGDSIIDSKTRIGAGIITANKRIDRGEITTLVKNKLISTKLKSLGCVIGKNAKIGVSVKTMPGVFIGANTIIGSGTSVGKHVPSNTKYYTKFSEIVEKNKGN
ncbi:MAG: NTP transferase domain-containing protein [Candidatus Aenigmarchaeota archaeon]|nr:NTP transferase domain-containing protein [Candidatus Aenigmarchaeota archaeon]